MCDLAPSCSKLFSPEGRRSRETEGGREGRKERGKEKEGREEGGGRERSTTTITIKGALVEVVSNCWASRLSLRRPDIALRPPVSIDLDLRVPGLFVRCGGILVLFVLLSL